MPKPPSSELGPWQAATPVNEARRLEALHAYNVLDTEFEQAFDDVVRLAANICGTPIALTSLIDADRQWFKARLGVDATETPRHMAFCAHAILGKDVLVVEDAHQDVRFAENPLVVGDPHVRFYAGAPLVTPDGLGLGTVCVIDQQPRIMSKAQLESLQALARQTMLLLEHRRVMADLAASLEQNKNLQALLPMCAWCKGVRSDEGYWHRVEEYITHVSGADVSHGICPPCMEKIGVA